MIYNFSALGLDDEDDQDPIMKENKEASPEEKRIQIEQLTKIRNEKRKELFLLQSSIKKGTNDEEHQAKVKDLSKQIINLSNEAELTKNKANELENKFNDLHKSCSNPIDTKPQSQSEINSQVLHNLRLQTDKLKTDISKAKRVLSQEGGCKNRALQIKKLKQQIEDLKQYSIREEIKTPSSGPIDIQELKASVTKLQSEEDSLNFKLKGLRSRIQTLEKSGLKVRVKANLALSHENDRRIEALIPKEEPPKKKQFRGHISQQSRLSVVIHGLNHELAERARELNLNKVIGDEPGLCKEIERLQKRLHLLESSMSCVIEK